MSNYDNTHHISRTEGNAPLHPLFAIVDTPGFQGNAFFYHVRESIFSQGKHQQPYVVAQYLVPTLTTRVITEVNLDR